MDVSAHRTVAPMTRRREKFPEWLAAQPDAWLEHYFGTAEKVRKFRNGSIVVERYSDPPRRMTLDDLAASRPEELPRLGVTNGPDKEE
jgi:hypothetical protein